MYSPDWDMLAHCDRFLTWACPHCDTLGTRVLGDILLTCQKCGEEVEWVE